MEDLKRDPLIRTLIIIFVAVLAFGLVYSLLFGSGYSNYGTGHYGMNGAYYGMGHYNGQAVYGSGIGFSLTGLLLLVIKILFIFLIIGLVAGIAKAIKQEVLPNANMNSVQGLICASPQQAQVAAVKEVCSGCGKELESDWKVCPYCTKEK